jgi:hypothetical protein
LILTGCYQQYMKLTLAEGLTVTSRLGYERSNSIDSRWNPIYYITSEAQNSSVTLRNNISRNSKVVGKFC